MDDPRLAFDKDFAGSMKYGNIDGIHKITKVDLNNPLIFYIDEYIEKCGNAVTVQPLVTTRFVNKEQRTNAALSTAWNLPEKVNVFTNNHPNATLGKLIRGTYVWNLNEYITSSAGVFVLGQDYVIVSPGINFTGEKILSPLTITPFFDSKSIIIKSLFSSIIT